MTARRAFAVVTLLACGAGAAGAQATAIGARPMAAACTPNPYDGRCVGVEGKPAIRYERVTGEIVAGTYAGVLGYFAGRGLGTIATAMMSAERDRLRERIVNGVGIGGAAFAIGGTVYAIGNIGAETGSFQRTMVGVSAGVAASLLLSKVVFEGRMPSDEGTSKRKWLMAALESSLPAIGGTIAFNRSRRWER